jgi:NADPH:quinone reductase-like Zn-dependent oxidoreductase
VGDEVFGSSGMRFGAHAEYVCVAKDAALAEKPRNLSFAEAAAIPLGGWNALHFMRRARVSAGERVLIIGAGGSIGSFAVQIAKHWGAHVTAVDAPHKLEWLRGLGADQVVDYTKADGLDAREAYDVVFSTIAGSDHARCLRALNQHGRYLMANPRLSDMLRSLWTNLTSTRRATFAFAAETREELQTLRAMAESGQLRPTLDRVLPLEDAAVAHERVETEERVGAVVLEPGLARRGDERFF